jgi:hypothetical protein
MYSEYLGCCKISCKSYAPSPALLVYSFREVLLEYRLKYFFLSVRNHTSMSNATIFGISIFDDY